MDEEHRWTGECQEVGHCLDQTLCVSRKDKRQLALAPCVEQSVSGLSGSNPIQMTLGAHMVAFIRNQESAQKPQKLIKKRKTPE